MEHVELMTMQEAYKAAVEEWVTALREEEATPTSSSIRPWNNVAA
jgi:hypothetical protein